MSALPQKHTGPFTAAHAERLLWRAGFGPTPGQAEKLAALGLTGAVHSLTRPKHARLIGAAPSVNGQALAPGDVWGHDALWWLDRMVRSTDSATERLLLTFHDWFATSVATVPPNLVLAQNRTMRKYVWGTFPRLFTQVTKDPAMLLWLNGVENVKGLPNENYAREMLELFTLGAGNGYGEDDIRELARALTGFRNDWSDAGPSNFRYDPALHDDGVKTVFGKKGRFDWHDALDLAVGHRDHPAYFVRRLWDHYVPIAPSKKDTLALVHLYTSSGHKIRPVVEAILMHPKLLDGPRMVKPPMVYIAGLLRALKRPVDTDAWVWLSLMAGQRPFLPPNVAGWDATRWIDTATWRGRWLVANYALADASLDVEANKESFPALSASDAVDKALGVLGNPTLTPATRSAMNTFAAQSAASANDAAWKPKPYAVLRHNALLMLIATSPDLHTA